MLVVFIRTVLLYLLVIFCMRLMGKRQLGELQPSELVTTILISNIAALPIEDTNIPMILGAVPILALVMFEFVVSELSLKSRKVRKFFSGSPVVVIKDGIINQKQLKKLRFSVDDLMEALRGNGVFDISEVNYAIVETTGQVSVLQKFSAQTVTAAMLSLTGEEKKPPLVVISDGEVIDSTLPIYGFSADWLERKLKARNLETRDIFLMTIDQDGNDYVVLKNETKEE